MSPGIFPQGTVLGVIFFIIIFKGACLRLTFDERFQTKLSDDANLLQEMVDNLKIFSSERQMLVNTDKSSVMKFSTSRTKDFPAEISLDD